MNSPMDVLPKGISILGALICIVVGFLRIVHFFVVSRTSEDMVLKSPSKYHYGIGASAHRITGISARKYAWIYLVEGLGGIIMCLFLLKIIL